MIFETEEQALEYARKCLNAVEGGFMFSPLLFTVEKTQDIDIDAIAEDLKQVVFRALGNKHMVRTSNGSYKATTLGIQGKKILSRFLKKNPEKLDLLTETISDFYTTTPMPPTLTNFFINDFHQDLLKQPEKPQNRYMLEE